MGLFKRLLGREPERMKLLSATIIADEHHRYFVSFEGHHPDLQMTEFVRIVLHYYAKMLFIPDPSEPEVAESAIFLQDAMQKVLDDGISKDSNILRAADIDDVADLVEAPPTNIPRKIVADMYFVSAVRRHITTEIPRDVYMQQTAFSVFALLQAALKELDEENVRLLGRALTRMNELYASGQDYTDLQNLSAIPTAAYADAVMGE